MYVLKPDPRKLSGLAFFYSKKVSKRLKPKTHNFILFSVKVHPVKCIKIGISYASGRVKEQQKTRTP